MPVAVILNNCPTIGVASSRPHQFTTLGAGFLLPLVIMFAVLACL